MTESELNAESYTLDLLWIIDIAMDSSWIYLDLAPWYLNLVLGSLHYSWSMILAGVILGLTTSMTTLAGLTD